MDELPDFLTVREVAEIFRISPTTAYKEVQRFLDTGGREGIPVLLIGGQKRIPRQKLEPLAGGPVHLPADNDGPSEPPEVAICATAGRRNCLLRVAAAHRPCGTLDTPGHGHYGRRASTR